MVLYKMYSCNSMQFRSVVEALRPAVCILGCGPSKVRCRWWFFFFFNSTPVYEGLTGNSVSGR